MLPDSLTQTRVALGDPSIKLGDTHGSRSRGPLDCQSSQKKKNEGSRNGKVECVRNDVANQLVLPLELALQLPTQMPACAASEVSVHLVSRVWCTRITEPRKRKISQVIHRLVRQSNALTSNNITTAASKNVSICRCLGQNCL